MRSKVCLLALALLGAGLTLLPLRFFEFADLRQAPGWLPCWSTSLRWFAIPLSLFVLSLRGKSRFLAWCRVAWGLWMAFLSLAVLLNSKIAPPFHSTYGSVAVGVVLMFALALAVFSSIEATTYARPVNNQS